MERELWQRIVRAIGYVMQVCLSKRFTFSVQEILQVYLWAVVHDRPVSWACDAQNWPAELRPARLPTPSTMSRRLRRLECQEILRRVHRHLRRHCPRGLLAVVDGKPFALRDHTTDPDAAPGWASGGFAKGYKLHAICGSDGHIRAWTVTAMNANEPKVASTLIHSAGITGYLLGDANYDTNGLHEACRQRGIQLVAPRRRGPEGALGHRPHSPGRVRAKDLLESSRTGFGPELFATRETIERSYGNLASAWYGLAALPPWVRRLHRVELWVTAKIVILTLAHRRRKAAS